MKRALARFLISREFQLSVWSGPLRWFVQRTQRFIRYAPNFLIDIQAIERPAYAYCMQKAAVLAKLLGGSRVSVLEFGAGDGAGRAFMKSFAVEMKARLGVDIDCYGFAEGARRASPESVKDLPYRYEASPKSGATPALQTEAGAIHGSFAETIPAFLETADPAPIGAIFVNDETHAATLRAFSLFDAAKARPDNFLPRLFLYLPYVTGTSAEMYGVFNGQLAAVEDFNALNEDMKIAANRNLAPLTHLNYRFQIFFAHLFDHPRYGSYVG